jgi:hypothetical protein
MSPTDTKKAEDLAGRGYHDPHRLFREGEVKDFFTGRILTNFKPDSTIQYL